MSVPAIGVVKLGDIGLMARFLGDLKSPSEFPLAHRNLRIYLSVVICSAL